jgi:dTDP-4-dehydrorhamnose reductase
MDRNPELRQTRILVTGSGGLLAPYLVEAARPRGRVVQTSRSSGDVPADLTNEKQVRDLIRNVNPRIILHTAALTDIEFCEKNPDQAELINGLVVRNLVQNLIGPMTLVHFSTDQVYPNVIGPHEEGTAAPVNTYGKSKLLGEQFASEHDNTLILRTTFFGASKTSNRSSLSDFFANQFLDRNPVVGFEDVFFSPLHMKTVGDLVMGAIAIGLRGTFNLGCRDGLSKAEFGKRIGVHLNLDTSLLRRKKSKMDRSRVPRPYDLRMNVSHLENAMGISMPTLVKEIAKL